MQNLGKRPQRRGPDSTPSSKYFAKKKILLLSYNLPHFVPFFKEIDKKTCPDVRSLLFLWNKELHKKFAPILIVCQRWRHSEKKQTCTTFFECHICWKCFSWENKITWSRYRFKKQTSSKGLPKMCQKVQRLNLKFCIV